MIINKCFRTGESRTPRVRSLVWGGSRRKYCTFGFFKMPLGSKPRKGKTKARLLKNMPTVKQIVGILVYQCFSMYYIIVYTINFLLFFNQSFLPVINYEGGSISFSDPQGFASKKVWELRKSHFSFPLPFLKFSLSKLKYQISDTCLINLIL